MDNASAGSPVEHLLAIVGALVPLASALSSYLNHIVRTKQAAGEPVNPLLLTGGSMLNAAALNVDKAVQLAKAVQTPAKAEPPKAE
jgi:hypothetical protein